MWKSLEKIVKMAVSVNCKGSSSIWQMEVEAKIQATAKLSMSLKHLNFLHGLVSSPLGL